MVMLDRCGQRLGQPPAAEEEHATDECMVDAEFAPLLVDTLLRGPGLLVDLGGIAG
jgi:hypothetical protein